MSELEKGLEEYWPLLFLTIPVVMLIGLVVTVLLMPVPTVPR